MICGECKFDNPAGMTFCGRCGTPLPTHCPSCGFENPLDFTFCGKCGYNLRRPGEAVSALRQGDPQAYTPKHLADKILSTRSAIEGERKQVTVLFADVSGFTSISEKLDPEEVHALMNRCLEFLMDEIHRYEGTITQFTGDAIMALFGAPIAHEDAPQRALYAAVGIQRSLSRYSEELKREQGIEFQMRIGLNTGPVVVGKIGDDLCMEYTAMGDTVNVAARMEQMAKPGTILVAEPTHRLTQGYFDFKPLGPVEVKGKAKPVTVYEVIGLGPIRTKIEAAELRGLTKFVGHIAEMEHLTGCYRRVKEGWGQVVAIVGEAGVGKSRLLLEFVKARQGEDFSYLEGHCIHYGEAMSYYPFIQMVKRYCGIEDTDPEFVYRKKLRDRVLGLDPALERLLPFLEDLLSLKVEDETYARMEPDQRRWKTLDAVRTLFIRKSQEKPLILAVEDMHWMDKSSEELLTHLIEGIANAKILLLCVYRPEYHHLWREMSYYSRLGVGQLPPTSSAELVEALLEDAKVAENLRELVLSKAGGNPLFIEEFTRSLLDSGAIARSDGQYVLTRKASEMEVPGTLQAAIAARIDQLEQTLKSVLQVASVIGRDFSFRVLRSILEMEEELRRYLDSLQSLEFVYEKRLFPELEYMFKHALTQEVAYNSLLIRRRKEFHHKIAQAVEEIYRDKLHEYVGVLAYHYQRAEDWEKALHYLTLSGNRAFSLYSLEESIEHYGGALEALGKLPDTVENRQRGIDLRFALYNPLMYLGYPEQRLQQVLGEAEEIAKEIGDRRRLIRSYNLAGLFHTVKGNHDLAAEYNEKCLAEAEEIGDAELVVSSAFLLGYPCFFKGQFRKSIELFQKVVSIQEETGSISETFGLLVYPYVWSSAWLGYSHFTMGHFEDSLTYLENALETAMKLDDVLGQGICHMGIGLCLVLEGGSNWEKGIEHLEQAAGMLEKGGFAATVASDYGYLGWAYHLKQQPDKAIEYFERCISMKKELAEVVDLALHYRNLAQLYLGLGDCQKALRCGEEALAVALKSESKWLEGLAYQALGGAYLNMSPPQYREAETYLLDSIRLLEEVEARPYVLPSYRGLAALYKERGERERARECLSRAISMCEEMGMERDLAQARDVDV